jgi:hypothetical protein
MAPGALAVRLSVSMETKASMEAVRQDHVDQADVGGVVGVEGVSGQEQGPGPTRADGLDDIGGDGRGDQAQLDLGEGEFRAVDAHRHVAGGDDARPAAHGRALDDGDRQGRNVVQGLQHLRQTHGVVAVVALGPVGGRAHPRQVGAGAERAARAPR